MRIGVQISLSFITGLLLPAILCTAQGTWTKKADFAGTQRAISFSFSIGAKGYVGCGCYSNKDCQDFWEWDQITDTWTQKADFGGGPRRMGTAFSIGNKGYAGTGFNGTTFIYYNDLWEYNTGSNMWTQLANLPAPVRAMAFSFSIGNKGYIGGGQGAVPLSDFWEYDGINNTWTQQSLFPGSFRVCSSGFSIGNKGYIVAGHLGVEFQDLWEWDQVSNTWTQLANLPGPPRGDGVGFAIGNYGYYGTGIDNHNKIIYSDFWQYNPITNSWSQMANAGGGVRGYAFSFTIGCKGYVGAGYTNKNYSNPTNDFWEFIPPVPSAAVAGVNTLCTGDSTSLFASGGLFFQWSTGETTASIGVKPPATTTYSVIVFDACGADTAAMTVTVVQYPVISVSYTKNLCGTGEVQFTDSTAYGNTWNWNFGDGSSTSSLSSPSHMFQSAGQYVVTLTVSPSPFGCTKTTQMAIDVPPFSELYIPNAFSPNGDGNNDTYFLSGSCISQMELKIYNRWGEMVFETSDQNQVWDGTFKGEKQNAGVYMYSLKGILTSGEEIIKKGNITLMR